MNFLLRLALSGGMAGCLALVPLIGNAYSSGNIDITAPVLENTTNNPDGFNLLNSTRSITNPYSSNGSQPFAIVEQTYDATAALVASVTCGGQTWTDGEYLGTHDNKEIRTFLHEGRIYFKKGGQVDNPFWVFQANNTKYPNTTSNDALLNRCVNHPDPSTIFPSPIGTRQGDVIPCNNKPIKHHSLLGTYLDDKGRATQQFAAIDEGGRLRIVFQQPGASFDPYKYGMGLINQTIDREYGSYMNDKLGYTLTKQDIAGCFWDAVPKYPDAAPTPNCATAPTIGTITNLTQTGLQFTYSGNGVSSVKWRIRLRSNNSLMASGTSNTATSNITFGSLAYGDYKLEIEGNNCASTTNSRDFSLSLPNCSTAPTIGTITNTTQTGLQFTYSGNGVSSVKWSIKPRANNNVLASGTSNTATSNITFGSLAYGDYKLEIEGNNCASVTNSRDFSITLPNCSTAPTIGTITNSTQTGLQFTYSGNGVSSVKWRIKPRTTSNVLASGTSNTTTSNITFGSLAYGDYKLEIEGNNCTSAINSKDFSISQPVVPNCQGGPAINSITSVTPSTATINFGGTNLNNFSWRILSGNKVLGYGKTGQLSTKSANIEYNYLATGSYTFELTAEDCKTSTKPTSTLAVPAGADTRTNCDRGPSLESIESFDKDRLTFRFDGNNVYGIDWKIMQGANVVRQNRVKPQSNTPSFDYPTLPDGNYSLQIQGGTCKSANSTARTFSINNSLPIYISNFKGNVVENGVELSWNVVSEKDGAGFEILRLDDQTKIAEVIGKVSLTDQRTGMYKFIDEAPLLGINYYQLKQIDQDGSFTKSNIISVTPGIITGTVVAPNPAKDYVNIQFTSRTAGTADLEIFNISGIRVSDSQLSIKEGKNNHRVNVGELTEGNYFIKVSHAGESSKLRFIKAN
jgi:hypothetical protein